MARRAMGFCQDMGGFGTADEWEAACIPPSTPSSMQQFGDKVAPGPRSLMGVCTLANRGKGGENQDAYVASASSSGYKSLAGVFDGHGEQGRALSEIARSSIVRNLFNHKDLYSDPVAALESAYQEAQRQIEASLASVAQFSGTTAVAAYRHRDRLYVANVGDSRCVLGRCDSSRAGDRHKFTGAKDGSLRAVELSSDQRPGREDERRRILAEGGAVHPSVVQVRQGAGPPLLMPAGPERVWDRTGRCGLGVTRSLGDLSMRPFVTAQPEVSERRLDPKDKLLVLGSDGVWDRMGSQEAVDIAARHKDPAAAASEIACLARQRWIADTRGQLSDDITAVVVQLEHDTLPSSAKGRRRSDPTGHPVSPSSSLPASTRRGTIANEIAVGRFGHSQRLAALESLRATKRSVSRPAVGRGPR